MNPLTIIVVLFVAVVLAGAAQTIILLYSLGILPSDRS